MNTKSAATICFPGEDGHAPGRAHRRRISGINPGLWCRSPFDGSRIHDELMGSRAEYGREKREVEKPRPGSNADAEDVPRPSSHFTTPIVREPGCRLRLHSRCRVWGTPTAYVSLPRDRLPSLSICPMCSTSVGGASGASGARSDSYSYSYSCEV